MLEKIYQHWIEHKDRPFLIASSSGELFTYGALYTIAAKTAAFLLSLGLKKSDRFAILLENCTDFAFLYFGGLYMGAVAVPINPALGEEYAKYVVANSQAKLLITQNDIDININKIIISPGDLQKLINNFDLELECFHKVIKEEELILVYTSGTTSTPKGIIHTYETMFSNALLFCGRMKLNGDNVFINYLPMAYLGGYYNLLLLPFISGGTVILWETFNAVNIFNFWKPVIKYNVNTLWLVPTIIAMLLEFDKTDEGKEYCKKNKILGIVGTAPLLPNIQRDFEDKYDIQLYENYALSETLFLTSTLPLSPENNGVGKPLDDKLISIAVLDKAGNLKKTGEGEIVVKTSSIMKQYVGEKILHSNDWFYTGDVGKIEQSGVLYITGRKKDLIIKGGINISPQYIVNILLKCKLIKDSCVIGIPHKIMGEEVVYVLKVDPNSDSDTVDKDIRRFIGENIPLIYRATHILYLSSFPTTSTGKIQKAKIRLWAKENLEKFVQKRKNGKTQTDSNFFKPSHSAAKLSQAMSIKYNNQVYDLQNKGIDITVLSLGEAFFDLPLFSFNKLDSSKVFHYSHSRGLPELRKQLSAFFYNHYEVEFNSDTEIVITSGSKVAIYMALLAILNPGDEVLIPEPAWVSYPEHVRLCGAVPVMIEHNKSVYDYENYITNRTKAIIVNNPNNPSGRIFSMDEMVFLADVAKKYRLFILSDEAYSEFILEKDEFISFGNLDTKKEYCIVCNSMSKNYGISGWRLGYVISNSNLISEILKINQHLITCPATILEYYISAYFDKMLDITAPQIKDVVRKREAVASYMNKIGLEYMDGAATYYIFVYLGNSALSSVEFCEKLLEERHISAVPGIGYGQSCDRYIRISVGTEPIERIYKALDIIRGLINE